MRLSTLLTSTTLLASAIAAPSPQPDPQLDRRAHYLESGSSLTPDLEQEHTHSPAKPPPPPPSPPSTKYFHEPGGDNELGHYDIRYFSGKPVTYEERGVTLYHLIRSYLTVFREREIETWIAHGTLLGWWWNGQIMPWDWDLDTQVSAATLTWLGENMNMTTHNYTSTGSDGVVVEREYLLDVNPHIVERVRGDGMNVIDARWIDMTNGLFIDITGLAETGPVDQPGIWSCKNYHRYRTRDIYPLRETMFEGVSALVPYSFDRILVEEYSARALTKTMHEGHTWSAEQKEWIKQDPVNWDSANAAAANMNSGYGGPVAHAPRSLPGEARSLKGLKALRRLI